MTQSKAEKVVLDGKGIMNMCNPVGRPVLVDDGVMMESSASNLTLYGWMEGEVAVLLQSIRTFAQDQCGLFVEIDGVMEYTPIACGEKQWLTVAKALPKGNHVIRISKSTDANNNRIIFYRITFAGRAVPAKQRSHRVEFVGDSITAGIGVFKPGQPEFDRFGLVASYYAYPRMAMERLKADYYCVANGGWRFGRETCTVPGEEDHYLGHIYDKNSMSSPLGAYDFAWKPELVVINLGTNDANHLKGGDRIYTKEQYISGVHAMIDKIRRHNPDAVIMWAYGAMGCTYDMPNGDLESWLTESIDLYNREKATSTQVSYVHLPPDQGGLWAHPSEEGHKKIAAVLADAICQRMGWEIDSYNL